MSSGPDDRSPYLAELTDRVLRHRSPSIWRQLFLELRQDRIVFEEGQGTFLSARIHGLTPGSSASVQAEIDFVAARHGAELDPWPMADVLMCFRDPASALEAALDLNQLVGGASLQVGLASGACTIGVINEIDSTVRVWLGEAVRRAGMVSSMAPAGTVRMAPEVFDVLEDRIHGLARCLVTTEYDSAGIEAVSVAMAPRASEALSTFAGLGLT